jgi:hypothetical protein
MHLESLLRNRRTNHGTWLGSLVLGIALIATLAVPAASAFESLPNGSATFSAPPSYPDVVHVFNGCHLSTLRYLSRFLSEFPQEHGQTLTISMMEADGTKTIHTIALISWLGQSWCRDEYFGVFCLNCRFDPQADLRRLVGVAEIKLHEQAAKVIGTTGMPLRRSAPTQMSAEQRISEVTAATRIIPGSSTIFWVQSGQCELPLAFFRPTAQLIAVYDPLHGTCTAKCSNCDDSAVVRSVAERLGYRPVGVRKGRSSASSAQIASVIDASHAYAAQ